MSIGEQLSDPDSVEPRAPELEDGLVNRPVANPVTMLAGELNPEDKEVICVPILEEMDGEDRGARTWVLVVIPFLRRGMA